jgi:nucleotide-binding universal stress UspA family protein
MYRYKRLLVGLSLANQDGTSISYAAMVSQLAKSEKVYFVHVARSFDIPEELAREYPDLIQPVDEATERAMRELVSKYFDGNPEAQIEYEVEEGSLLVELLRRAKQLQIDLIIMRKRRKPTTSGTLLEKIARKAPCSVLFVPERCQARFTNILVPIDFSENSADAMDVALAFASASGIKKIYCVHVYEVPIGYYKTGKSYEHFAKIMKGHAERQYRDFMDKIDLKGVSVIPAFELAKQERKGIEAAVREHQADLLIMGARGRKAGAGVLLGSVTEDLIRASNVPLLAAKKKGTGMRILDALLKL